MSKTRILPWKLKDTSCKRHKTAKQPNFTDNTTSDIVVITMKKAEIGPKLFNKPKKEDKKVILHHPSETKDFLTSNLNAPYIKSP
jgi:hypothetical protein